MQQLQSKPPTQPLQYETCNVSVCLALYSAGEFVFQFLQSQTGWEKQPGHKIEKGQELNWYATHALQVHRANAFVIH